MEHTLEKKSKMVTCKLETCKLVRGYNLEICKQVMDYKLEICTLETGY